MKIVRSISLLREEVSDWRRRGLTCGVVPTMGALHEGHLALVDRARNECDRVVATLFVNPLQFGPSEDFASYPRDEASDSAKLRARRCDLLFAPTVAEMFPDGKTRPEDFPTVIIVRGLTDGLCGPFRPGHFVGVATEVTKLLSITQADIAYFGEKDFQQLQVIRRMVHDLNLPLRVAAVATVREADGLAMSSRNAYLSPAERRIAPLLFQELSRIAAELRADPERDCVAVADAARRNLLAAGFRSVDYLIVVDEESLSPVERIGTRSRAMAAAWLGRTRLIDNCAVQR